MRQTHPSIATPVSGTVPPSKKLIREIGLFDATMVVNINPYVVAQRVHSPLLIIAAWTLGGLTAMPGAFIYAELAD